MTDSERTEYDDSVDEAIEVLIDDSTEAFVLVGMQDDSDVHLIQASENVEQELLAVFMLVENMRKMAAQTGREMLPHEVLIAAGHVAMERGYLSQEANWTNYRECERLRPR
jgi:hypothetical protein